jgi:hypothetical protein
MRSIRFVVFWGLIWHQLYTSCLTIPHPPREATATLPVCYGAMGVPFDALYEHANDYEYDYDYDYEYDYDHL